MKPENPALKKRIHYQPTTEAEINSLVERVRSSGGEGLGIQSDDYLAAEKEILEYKTICGRSDKFQKQPRTPEQRWLDRVKELCFPTPRRLRNK